MRYAAGAIWTLAITLAGCWCRGASAASGQVVMVDSAWELARAIGEARPGTEIVLRDGDYTVARKIAAAEFGTVDAPVVVRSEHPLRAVIHSRGLIVFEVTGQYWHFEDLDIRGECGDDSACEHAFHVVAPATGFVLRNSRLRDFNAHVKVNANEARDYVGTGLIERNEFWDTHPRRTDNPVAAINIDVAEQWVVRDNLVHDFQKAGRKGDTPYGIFAKGGSVSPIIEGNLVECASGGPPVPDMVGISLGAAGMAPALCPPHFDAAVICDPETTNGTIRNNVVGMCSAAGILVNRGRDSRVVFNTVIDTQGIEFRHKGATGVARGNILEGGIIATDGARLEKVGNIEGVTDRRSLLPGHGGALPASVAGEPGMSNDYCGRKRPATPSAGAVEASLGACELLKWHWPARQ